MDGIFILAEPFPIIGVRGIVVFPFNLENVMHLSDRDRELAAGFAGPDDLEVVNSGLGELLGIGDLTPAEQTHVGTPEFWQHEEDVREARRLLGEGRL